MSIIQGHVIETNYPPAGNCIVSTLPGSFTLVDNISQTETNSISYASCSISCTGDVAVIAHSGEIFPDFNQILTFNRIEGAWTLVDTKSLPANYYPFLGKDFYRNNDRVKISGNGKKLFIVIEKYVNFDVPSQIISYTWNGTTWDNEQIISIPETVAEIGVISVSYDGKTLAGLGVDTTPFPAEPNYVHMIWEKGSWAMVNITNYKHYFIYTGVAVSSDGSTVAFGNSGGNISNENDEPIIIYTKVDSVWTETGTLTVPNSGLGGYSYFGACLSLNTTGDVLAIGAPLYTSGGTTLEPGRAYVAALTDGVWGITATLEYPGSANYTDWRGWFGMGVAITANGGRIAIMPEYGGKTAADPVVFIYDDIDDVWTLTQSPDANTPQHHRENSVALAGDGSSMIITYVDEFLGSYGTSYGLFYNIGT